MAKLKRIPKALADLIEKAWQRRLSVLVRIIAIVVLPIAGVVIYWALRPSVSPEWAGFKEYSYSVDSQRTVQVVPAKTLWDWMDLLIVSAALAVGLFLLNSSQRKNERELARNKQHQTTLETYFDRMTALILENGLGTDDEEVGAEGIARTRTLAVLRSLDGERVTALINFIRDAGLGKGISFASGNLRGVNWKGANLYRANFSSYAFLREANLSEAYLGEGNFSTAYLDAADLSKADLSRANLKWADLSGANLRGARNLSNSQVALVSRLQQATMQDGRRYDGRFNLQRDIEDARRSDIDIDDPKAMAGFYQVSTRAYLRGQAWAGKNNLERLRQTGQWLLGAWGFEDEKIPVTPQQSTRDLIRDVGNLFVRGVLEARAGAGLTEILPTTPERIDQVQDFLPNFIEEMNKLINEGDLAAAEGRPLIDWANEIITAGT